MYIYEILNTKNNKRYIGQTRSKYRLPGHKSLLLKNKHSNAHLQYSWNKHGENCFTFSILEFTDNLEERERFWITFYKSNDRKFGYNLTSGGEINKQFSEETIKKISVSQKKRFQDIEQRKKCSTRTGIPPANKGIKTGKPSWQSGKSLTEETKDKIRKTKKSNKYIVSSETRLKISDKLKGNLNTKGRKMSEAEYSEFCKSHGAKTILVFDEVDSFIGEWVSLKKCGRDLNIDTRGIRKNLQTKTMSFKNMVFKYKD